MPESQVQNLKRFRFLSTDKITGRVFKLCAEGESEDLAAERIWNLGFLISSSEPCPWIHDPTLKPKMKLIGEEFTEDPNHLEGNVRAVNSAEFGECVKQFNTESHPFDRHWMLCNLVSQTERSKEPSLQMLCELFCWQWMVERESLYLAIVNEDKLWRDRGFGPEVNAIDRLRIMHDGERAAQICEYASGISFPVANRGWLLKKAKDYRLAEL
ncbi:MAG: hypothetical protein ACF8K1_13880 [Phycisphaerales bacterium JB047]